MLTYETVEELCLDFAITFAAAIHLYRSRMNVRSRQITLERPSTLTHEIELLIDAAFNTEHAVGGTPTEISLQLFNVRDL
jgi:hypothetical protein